jgi:hypothetical protein
MILWVPREKTIVDQSIVIVGMEGKMLRGIREMEVGAWLLLLWWWW